MGKQTKPSPRGKTPQKPGFPLIHWFIAYGYLGLVECHWMIPLYGFMMGYLSHTKHGTWYGYSMAASIYISQAAYRHHHDYYYVAVPLFILGGFGPTRHSIWAAAVAAAILYSGSLPGMYAYAFFVYGYLLAGTAEACWLGAVAFGYNLEGWTLAIPVALVGGYCWWAKEFRRQADIFAKHRAEQKEEIDMRLAELEELEPGNIVARDLALATAEDEVEIRRVRDEVAKENAFFLAFFSNYRVNKCEEKVFKRYMDRSSQILNEWSRLKGI
ncbi:uncharacterized protein PgNI_02233 [Pyricularia grisea]|uniref:Uncharacterized protein n=1 Tax=Pyricularia grisea TaxID=148305 RepID=A0A6P8BL51_PYRGI|nr:uncharacterized protein PgNI_02233 [Pyricularia grisea]TLD17332.1 hypothetical protein PgNI_02233 [Pyricularia grisea]